MGAKTGGEDRWPTNYHELARMENGQLRKPGRWGTTDGADGHGWRSKTSGTEGNEGNEGGRRGGPRITRMARMEPWNRLLPPGGIGLEDRQDAGPTLGLRSRGSVQPGLSHRGLSAPGKPGGGKDWDGNVSALLRAARIFCGRGKLIRASSPRLLRIFNRR